MTQPEDHPNDTKKQAILRIQVQRMMDAATERNAEGERIAEDDRVEKLASNVAKAVEALLREPLSERATLVLMDDGDVRWEEPE